jgi:sporulation-control protein spo0M
VTLPRIALGLLGVLAIVLGANLVSATNRFVTAYDAYDAVRLELVEFEYTSPDEPVRTVVTITNPTGITVEVRAIELRLDAGIRRVGGGETRINRGSTAEQIEAFTLLPGETQEFEIILNIDDRTYVRDLGDAEIDWRVTGRFQVKLDEGIDEEWITA